MWRPRQAWRCAGICGEFVMSVSFPFGKVSYSSDQLKLRGAHHQMHEFAHCLITRVRVSRFEKLHKRVPLSFGRTTLEKAPAQKIHKVTRPVAELVGHKFADVEDRKSTRLNSSHSQISYAVFC